MDALKSVIEDIAEMQKKMSVYKYFFMHSLDLGAIANFEGYFTDANTALLSRLGYVKEFFLKTPFMEFVHPDDVEKTKNAFVNLTKGQDVTGFVNRYKCSDGTYVTLDWDAKCDGELMYCVAREVKQ